MKTIAIILFGTTIASISSAFGLNIIDEPVKFCMINFSAILCFSVTVELITKGKIK